MNLSIRKWRIDDKSDLAKNLNNLKVLNNLRDPFSRCNKEKLGKREVPVKGIVDHFDQYDAVLIGFPIWYGCAPNVVNTFCSGYDFTGKKVALFATSGGSGIGKTKEKLQPYVKGTTIIDAKLVSDGDDLV